MNGSVSGTVLTAKPADSDCTFLLVNFMSLLWVFVVQVTSALTLMQYKLWGHFHHNVLSWHERAMLQFGPIITWKQAYESCCGNWKCNVACLLHISTFVPKKLRRKLQHGQRWHHTPAGTSFVFSHCYLFHKRCTYMHFFKYTDGLRKDNKCFPKWKKYGPIKLVPVH